MRQSILPVGGIHLGGFYELALSGFEVLFGSGRQRVREHSALFTLRGQGRMNGVSGLTGVYMGLHSSHGPCHAKFRKSLD